MLAAASPRVVVSVVVRSYGLGGLFEQVASEASGCFFF